jgi:hypothetical protein
MDHLMQKFDQDNDGSITIVEFADFATADDGHRGGEHPAERKLHDILESANQQGLDYEEAFESFDSDGDGQISRYVKSYTCWLYALCNFEYRSNDDQTMKMQARMTLNV